MAKIILHIDLNQFFVRCEEIKNPLLIGKAVAVGGEGRRGIISTCSYKAREYGIHSGMPTFQAKMLCKDLIICRGDYKYYELMSKEFINFIKKFTYKVEQMSIDECFCDFTDILDRKRISPISFLRNLQNNLFKKTGLKCSIGVSTTKFLAKMGSDYKKPMGITIIRKRQIPEILFPLPVKDLFGIGKKTYPKLERAGYKTIGDLYYGLKNDDEALSNFFGSYKEDIINNLEGNSSDTIHVGFSDPKSMGMTRTLDFDTNDKVYIRKFLTNLMNTLLDDFSKSGKLCKTIQLTYKSSDYENGFKTNTVSKSLDNYTDSIDELYREGLKLFDKTYKNEEIRLIGFTLKNLKEKHDVVVQMTFENYERHESENKTQLLINELNRKSKKETFIRLSDLKDKKK